MTSVVQATPATRRTPVIRRGADLVLLAEELNLRMFLLGAAFTLVSCGVAVWFGLTAPKAVPRILVFVATALAAVVSLTGLARPRATYLWLRSSAWRTFSLPAVGALAMLLSGPDSPCWWPALGFAVITAATGSAWLAVAGALLEAGAYLAGTALGGQPLIEGSEAGVLPGAVGLVAYTLVALVLCEAFARFVLHLHQAERRELATRVPNLAAERDAAFSGSDSPSDSGSGISDDPRDDGDRRDRDRTPRAGGLPLTVRQLEAALLARDGLRREEIAECLAISMRQVDRLLSEARQRLGAATTAHLVALLVSARIAPPQGTDPHSVG